uniref:ATP-binding cassette sub-family G member 1-like n=1 Tax=Hirondellea gigas TaxID=1518452 RepID=A0A2P2I873_9CRUS
MSALQQKQQLDLTVKDLTYRVPDGKKGQRNILKGISGCFLAGQLTAILGPSGSGKTTFMNIAAGYRTHRVSGSILVNGRPRNLAVFRRNSCYITQADHLLQFLTVQESMKAAATLKLDPEARVNAQDLIDDILKRLRLTDCRCTRTCDLSGGETKRLSIALELVNNPPIMFFDEPTSGLDSRTSYQCLQLLQSLARGGRTIICTIHQPSARLFQMFDQLYALADGQCIYRGTTDDLLPFLNSMDLHCPPYHNPADFLVEIAVGEYGEVTERLVAGMAAVHMVSAEHDKNLDVVPEGDHRLQENKTADIGGSLKRCTSDTDSLKQSFSESSPNNKDCSRASSSIINKMDQNTSPCNSNGDIKTNNCSTYDDNYDVELHGINNGDLHTTFPCSHTTITVQRSVEGNLLETFDESALAFPSSMWVQFKVLFHRTLLTIVRDMMLTKLRLGAHIVVALLIGLLYYGVGNEASKVMDNSGCLFFIMLFFIFTAMMPTILTFPMEMNVLVREYLNRWYSLKSYYIAKTVADLPFQIGFPLVSVLITYCMTDQPMELWRVCLFTFFCIMTSLVAQSIGLTIGAAFTVQESVFLGPSSIVPMLLFSGFFIQFNTIPVYMRWITYLSFVRYGFEGALLSVYGFGRGDLECSEAFCYLRSSSKILQTLNIEEENICLDVGMLLVYFFVVRIMGYYILRWKVRKPR